MGSCLCLAFQACQPKPRDVNYELEHHLCRVAGEIAAEPQEGSTETAGPATARLKLIDALHSIGEKDLQRVKISTELIASR